MSIYQHIPHPHKPRNVNKMHKEEQEAAGFNKRLAILLTRSVGTMVCAYIFAVIAILGFPLLPFGPLATQMVQWTSQTFIQLTMLSVIMVGQAVLGRHAELLAEEQFNTTQKTYHDIEQVMAHLDAQDEKILEILRRIEQQQKPTPRRV